MKLDMSHTCKHPHRGKYKAYNTAHLTSQGRGKEKRREKKLNVGGFIPE